MRTVSAAVIKSWTEAGSFGFGRSCANFVAHDSSPPAAFPTSLCVAFDLFCPSQNMALPAGAGSFLFSAL